jgi:flagellar motor switch protein FliN/FliY
MHKDKITGQGGGSAPGTDPNWPRDLDARLHRLGGANMEVTVRLGHTRLPLEDVLNAEPGALVEMDTHIGEALEILVNGELFGKGEIVVVGDNLAVRITDLATPA